MAHENLPFLFEPIPFEYIDKARKNGETVDYCPQLREIWRLLNLVGGWGSIQNQAGLAFALYEDLPTTSHENDVSTGDKDPVRGRRGMIRLENILSGKRLITKREARAFLLALEVGFGREWSALLSPEELVKLSAKDLFEMMARNNLPWPHALSPSQSLQVLATLRASSGLTIQPVFENSMRATVVPGHENEMLVEDDQTFVYQEGERFTLSIDGLVSKDHEYLVVELCFDGLRMKGSQERFDVLPLSFGKTEGGTMTLDAGSTKFQIGQAKGRFAFVVWSAPSEIGLLAQLPFGPEVTRLDASCAEQLARLFREVMIAHPEAVRSAMHEYVVA